jgi:predicted Rossmann fold nucleotide-binding protein DprA/Smf involved in DNA uptake
MITASLGNQNILTLRKTAFLCSREIPASIILKCYDWAIEQREQGNCVISGFHSKIEKDVFHYLLEGNQPVIMTLARGMKDKFDSKIQHAVRSNRLLIVTPFDNSNTRVIAETAEKRNKFMLDLADEIVIGYAGKNGMLMKTIEQFNKRSEIHWLSK